MFASLRNLPECISCAATALLHNAFCSGPVILIGLHLVERRGQAQSIDVKRQVDLSTLMESIPDPVFLFDNHGRIIDANRPGEELCDRTRDQLRNLSIEDFNLLLAARDEADRPVPSSSMGVNRALRGELVRHARRVFRHPESGRTVETATSASPIRDANGEVRGVLLIVRDITEIIQLQRRLADAQRHKEVGQMAAGLAHDFANVLDTIGQAATLLDMESDKPADERREYTRMIQKAVERGAEIIDRVREYLRTGTGRQAELDVRDLLRDVVDLTHPLWHGKRGFRLRTELQAVGKVCGNAADLRRVFTNLVINALEAMPEGGELFLRCEQAGDQVHVTVSDTGQGIAPEQQKHLFVPYFTTKPEGTGLGLSGAQRTVNSLGGQIRFRSEPGKGTTFCVDLPLASKLNAESKPRPREMGPQPVPKGTA